MGHLPENFPDIPRHDHIYNESRMIFYLSTLQYICFIISTHFIHGQNGNKI